MERFDLTKKSEAEKAIAFCKYFGMTAFPHLAIPYKIAKWIFDSDSAKKQGEIAKKLIEAGKETDVDEMEIILDNTKGFHFDAPIDEKCKIDTVIGSDEKVVIKVKYK